MRVLRLTAALTALLILGGCWDNVDISRQNYAMAVWLGASEDGVECLVQCCDPVASENGDGSANVIDVPGGGANISEALAQATRNSGKTITYEHLQLIIIDRSLCEGSVAGCLDFFLRSADVQKTVNVVAAESSPKEAFAIKPGGEAFYEYAVGLLASDIPSESELIPGSSLLSICRLEKDGHALFINKLRYDAEAEAVFPDGVFIFSGGVMRGSITADEWESYRFFEKKEEEFSVTCGVDGYGDNLGFRCISSECRFKAERTRDGFALKAKVEARFTLSEGPAGDASPALDPEFYAAAEEALRAETLCRCKALALTAQSELKTDFLGFGRAVENSYPEWWERNYEKWDELFASSPITYDISCSVITGGDAK